MNERIKKLAEQATKHYPETESSGEFSTFDKEKFAELIVGECIELNRQELSFAAFSRMMEKYDQHFGIKLFKIE